MQIGEGSPFIGKSEFDIAEKRRTRDALEMAERLGVKAMENVFPGSHTMIWYQEPGISSPQTRQSMITGNPVESISV